MHNRILQSAVIIIDDMVDDIGLQVPSDEGPEVSQQRSACS